MSVCAVIVRILQKQVCKKCIGWLKLVGWFVGFLTHRYDYRYIMIDGRTVAVLFNLKFYLFISNIESHLKVYKFVQG